MLHESADKIICLPAQSPLILRIREYIDPVPVQGHIDMHPGTADPILGLGHKCSVQTVPLRDRLRHHLKRHDVIRHFQCLAVLQVNLVLCRSDLMMGRLYHESHILQGQYHIAPCIFPQVEGTHVKIRRTLM